MRDTLQVTPVLPSLQWEGCFRAGTLAGTPACPFSAFSAGPVQDTCSVLQEKQLCKGMFLSGLPKISGWGVG